MCRKLFTPTIMDMICWETLLHLREREIMRVRERETPRSKLMERELMYG